MILTKQQAEEILHALTSLPPEKVAEVQDFIFFLKEGYSQEKAIDESDAWTEENLRDLTADEPDIVSLLAHDTSPSASGTSEIRETATEHFLGGNHVIIR